MQAPAPLGTTVSTEGRIVLPEALRTELGWPAGTRPRVDQDTRVEDSHARPRPPRAGASLRRGVLRPGVGGLEIAPVSHDPMELIAVIHRRALVPKRPARHRTRSASVPSSSSITPAMRTPRLSDTGPPIAASTLRLSNLPRVARA